MKKLVIPVFFAITIFVTSCSLKNYLQKIEEYSNASTVNDKEKFMADNYHSFFMEAKGTGEDKMLLYNHFKTGMLRCIRKLTSSVIPLIKKNGQSNSMNKMIFQNSLGSLVGKQQK